MMIGLTMTTFTKSNAIFWNSIVLHIINVVNFVSIFFTNSTRKVVSISNHLFKLAIKCLRIIFIAASPKMGFFSNKIIFTAFLRTKMIDRFVEFGKFFECNFTAICAFCFNAPHSTFIKTIFRTKLIFVSSRTKKIVSTVLTNKSFFSAFPKNSGFAFSHSGFTSTRIGTKSRRISSIFMYIKRLFAMLTDNKKKIFHNYPKRSAPFSGSVLLLRQYSLNETHEIKNLTNCFA